MKSRRSSGVGVDSSGGWATPKRTPPPKRLAVSPAAESGVLQPERRYLKDAYRYDPGKGWKKLADLPRAVVAAPSPAPVAGGSPLVLGGDDSTQLTATPDTHRGFSKTILRYDPKDPVAIFSPQIRADVQDKRPGQIQ